MVIFEVQLVLFMYYFEILAHCDQPACMHKEDFLHNSSFHMLPAGNIHELPELKSSFHSVGLVEKTPNEWICQIGFCDSNFTN